MMDLFQNSIFQIMGLWVAVSCISGLLVFIVVKIFDFLFSNQSSSDRYHKSIVGLLFFFLLNIASTYYVYKYTIQESGNSVSLDFNNSRQELIIPTLKEIDTQPVDSSTVISDHFFTSKLIFKSLGIFWLIGAFAFTVKMIGAYFYTKSLIKYNQESIPQKWSQFIEKQLTLLKIKKQIGVFESFKVNSAFTFGFIKPVVALPLGFFTTLPSEQIEAVLLHELYHIKYQDYLINLLTMAFEVIFFYHPAMWWLAKNIRKERENRCDDQVTQLTDKKVYAHALLNMESYRKSLNYAIPFSNKQSNLKMRIMRIFEQKPEQNIGLKPFLGLLMIVVFLMGFTFYKLDDPKLESSRKSNTSLTNELKKSEIPKKEKENVLFKSENSRLGVVIKMTQNTLIAKSDNKNVKLYIDERLQALNEEHPFGENQIATMFEIGKEASYHFFTRKYFDTHNRDKWEKENETRNTYVFDRATEFFTFKPAKNYANDSEKMNKEKIESVNSEKLMSPESISEIENRPPSSPEMKVFDPIEFRSSDDLLIDSANLELLKNMIERYKEDDDSDVYIEIDGMPLPARADLSRALRGKLVRSVKIELNSEDALGGLIEIETAPDNKDSLKESKDKEEIPVRIYYKTNRDGEAREVIKRVNEGNLLGALGINGYNTLFVIDGVEKPIGYKPEDILPNFIDHIVVLKDKKAIKKYGNKGKNGVIEIYLKKE